MQDFLTPELIAEVERVRETEGTDMVIGAQDFNARDIPTLEVEPQKENRYIVRYDRSYFCCSRHKKVFAFLPSLPSLYLIIFRK